MERPIPLSNRFRHVVFPGAAGARKKALNLSTPGEPTPLVPPEGARLSHEKASFLHWLFGQAGLDARLYRVETLQRRLPACLRALQAHSPGHARRLIEQDPSLVADAVSAMLVGVTAFFRDPGVFDLLHREVLPALTAARPHVYVWSAGCSDGAELYSVAVLLAEHGLLAQSYLLGTDCRPDAIRRARAGHFDPVAVRTVPPKLLDRYFTPREGGWQVIPAIAQVPRWRTADVLTTQEPGLWDLVLFRNAAMYLRAEAAGRLWERLEAALRPGGVLVLGKAERPLGAKRLSPQGPCIYRRTRG